MAGEATGNECGNVFVHGWPVKPLSNCVKSFLYALVSVVVVVEVLDCCLLQVVRKYKHERFPIPFAEVVVFKNNALGLFVVVGKLEELFNVGVS